MTEEELEAFRVMLVARLENIVAQGDYEVEPNRVMAGSVPDEDDQSLNEMGQIIASNRNREATAIAQKIRVALRRIGTDPEDFGYCAGCDEPIPSGRLGLMPWALHCVKCANAREPRRDGRRRHLTDYD